MAEAAAGDLSFAKSFSIRSNSFLPSGGSSAWVGDRRGVGEFRREESKEGVNGERRGVESEGVEEAKRV